MTNEQLAEFIQQGGNDEFTPILWERVRKLLYMIANKYYSGHCEICEKCGVTVYDLKQQAYSAYMGAVKAYSRKRGISSHHTLTCSLKRRYVRFSEMICSIIRKG